MSRSRRAAGRESTRIDRIGATGSIGARHYSAPPRQKNASMPHPFFASQR
jgi:hypothetical protein